MRSSLARPTASAIAAACVSFGARALGWMLARVGQRRRRVPRLFYLAIGAPSLLVRRLALATGNPRDPRHAVSFVDMTASGRLLLAGVAVVCRSTRSPRSLVWRRPSRIVVGAYALVEGAVNPARSLASNK